MDEELESMMRAVSLTEEEEDIAILSNDLLGKKGEMESLMVVGKVIATKQVNKEGLRLAMRICVSPGGCLRGFLCRRLARTYLH